MEENKIKCQRCNKEILKSEAVNHTIIGRGRKSVYDSRKGRYVDKACLTHTEMTFCSGTCAGNEQMSREG